MISSIQSSKYYCIRNQPSCTSSFISPTSVAKYSYTIYSLELLLSHLRIGFCAVKSSTSSPSLTSFSGTSDISASSEASGAFESFGVSGESSAAGAYAPSTSSALTSSGWTIGSSDAFVGLLVVTSTNSFVFSSVGCWGSVESATS